MAIEEADILRAAKELIRRYGDEAVAAAREHVAAISKQPDKSGLNEALRVLSAVEALARDERK